MFANIKEKCNNLPPIHVAASTGCLEGIQCLISKGADVNAVDDNGIKPLHLAAGNGNKEICEFLLERGASINAPNPDGVTPLHLAAEGGHLEVVRFLLSQGADFNSKTNKCSIVEKLGGTAMIFTSVSNWTPLDFAVNKKRYDVVKELLKIGIAANNDYIAPLGRGSSNFFLKVVEFLVSLNEEIDTQRLQKLFQIAVIKSSLEAIKILARKKIDINGKIDVDVKYEEDENQSALHYVIDTNLSDSYDCSNDSTVGLGLIKVLLEHGADPNIEDSYYHTPLDYTILRKYSVKTAADSVIHLLLNGGCSEETIFKCISLVKSDDKVRLKSVKSIIRHYLVANPKKEQPPSFHIESKCNSDINILSNYWDECTAEFEKMKNKYFRCDLSLYSFFVGKDWNKTGLYTKNAEIVMYCKSDDCRNNYSVYVDLILKKVEHGEKRQELMNMLSKIKINAKVLKNVTLSADCQLIIASYLSNEDFYNLIKAGIPEEDGCLQ